MSRPDAGRILACLAVHRHVQQVDLNRVAACWPPNDQMEAAVARELSDAHLLQRVCGTPPPPGCATQKSVLS